MKLIVVNFLVFILLLGCSNTKDPESDELTPKYEISFKKVTSIENLDFSDQDSISYIPFMGFIDTDKWGRIYVADGGLRRSSQSVRVFSREGKHLMDVGRSGRGPGEFQNLTQISVLSNQMITYDEILNRLSFYSLNEPGAELEVEFLSSVILHPQNWNHIDALKDTQPVEFILIT